MAAENKFISMNSIRIFIFTVILFSTNISPAANSSYGEVQWAFGRITGYFIQAVAIFEQCSKQFPHLQNDFTDAFSDYKKRNMVMDLLRDAFYLRARQEGGDAEAEATANSARIIVKTIGDEISNVVRSTFSVGDCQREMIRMRQGGYDLEIQMQNEINIILEK